MWRLSFLKMNSYDFELEIRKPLTMLHVTLDD
jgi:hypothetical protein